MIKVRTAARGALGRGAQLRRAAELERTLKGGLKADPQVTLVLYTFRAWQRALLQQTPWPPSEDEWLKPDQGRRGRGPLRHLKSLCERLGWSLRLRDRGFLLPLTHEAEGSASHTLYDCSAFASQRKEAKVAAKVPPPRGEDIPAYKSLVWESNSQPLYYQRSILRRVAGRHPLYGWKWEASHWTYPPPLRAWYSRREYEVSVSSSGCWQSVCRAELHAIMKACEMMDGNGVIVANKLKAGLRKPRGRHTRIESRILASIGDIQVQWMRSHLAPQQAAAAALPAAYVSSSAEADLLAGQAVQEIPGLPLYLLFTDKEQEQLLLSSGGLFWLLPRLSRGHKRTSDTRGLQDDSVPARSRSVPDDVTLEDQELPGPHLEPKETTGIVNK
eukprot:1350563-Amphidinium_carterae.2